ncbi:MAG: DNA recombination protein RmuC [Betaproteobacteria bacterium]|nr:DNA recombination protein RmuC [Betaproteobacteria bacterium]
MFELLLLFLAVLLLLILGFQLFFFFRARQRDGADSLLPEQFKGMAENQERQRRELALELRQEIREEETRTRLEATQAARSGREELSLALERLAKTLSEQLGRQGGVQAQQLDAFAQQLTRLTQSNEQRFEQLREAVEARLTAIRDENANKLEAMRQTVDEKLHATLEQRLGESFRLVSERLEQVHRGLGEMQTLAAGVGDLKKMLGNVKTRGTWGEIQLAALLEQMLAAGQYASNVAVRPGRGERVEFALRLPGRESTSAGNDEGAPVWLPIDAKFPIEDFQRLSEAQERADPAAVEAAAKALEARLRDEARMIREKYIEPPYTTDFAILYLPIEGLYAEALRRPGLVESLQRDQRVTLAGPTTLAALLNSLQMGFRTLAIEKRSSEVWAVLGAVKTEFGKFGEALAHTRKKLQEATNSIDKAEVRTRAVSRQLKAVEALPQADESFLSEEAEENDGEIRDQ